MNASTRSWYSSSFIAWVAIALASIAYLFTFDGFRPVLRNDRLRFGIDLVGGTYITLQVHTDKAVELELADKREAFLKAQRKAGGALPVASSLEKELLTLTFNDTNQALKAQEGFFAPDPRLKTDLQGSSLKVYFKEKEAEAIRNAAVEGNREVLRNRLDTFGVGEIGIAREGKSNIVIELPNVDPQKAKTMIGKTALLEIKPVERVVFDQESLMDEFGGVLPPDLELLPDQSQKLFYLVPKYTDITGRQLKNARHGLGGQSGAEPVVNFEFNAQGGDRFYDLTSKRIGKQVAVIIDGVVISAPSVPQAIGASGYIHGSFTDESAKELAMLLKSGAFVAPVSFGQERQIGPSLGHEAISQGLLACFVGLVLLVLFSILMYSVAGFFAFLALLMNLLLLLLALSWIKATLTLPGIAGMVLTVGMAIDASILIYEKMREELAIGANWKQAVANGFSDAMEVILDSNITTFIVGIVLYKFGTGPIQGFAVTMMIGIISTLLTGLFFLRSTFDFLLDYMGFKKLKI